jgi:hypothetical protein
LNFLVRPLPLRLACFMLLVLMASCGGSSSSGTNNSSAATRSLPDTGQTTSYTDTFGEDSDYTIIPPHYTKLDAAGNDLPDSATIWTMVRDDVTRLIWEVKTDDGGIHDRDNTYNWYDAQDVFITQLNSDIFGGASDWRLPTIKELSTLVHADTYAPAINTAYFPQTSSSGYWASTAFADYMPRAWEVHFFVGGVVSPGNKSFSVCVRAVRGAP